MIELHTTQIEMMLKCAAQGEFYLRGIKIPPAASLTRGSAYHSAVSDALKAKLQFPGEECMELQEVEAMFSDNWELLLKKERPVLKAGENLGEVKDGGIRMVGAWATWVYPDLAPAITEIPVRIRHIAGTLRCTIDFIGRHKKIEKIIDQKTASRAWSKNKVHESLQTHAYRIAARRIGFGTLPFSFHVAVDRRPDAEIQQLDAGELEEEFFWGVFEKCARMVESGIFPPNPLGWWCSEAWCGYWKLCRGKERR